MSLVGRLRGITADQLRSVQDRPQLVRALIAAKTELNFAKLLAASERVVQIALQKGTEAANDPAELEKARAQIISEIRAAGVTLPGDERDAESLSLENSWHVLHYLITGQAGEAPPPLGDAILGGATIGENLGHGPVRYLTPQQVRNVASALRSIAQEDLMERFDSNVMVAQKIYGAEHEDKFDMLEYYFAQLVQYYSDAAGRENAMLLYIY